MYVGVLVAPSAEAVTCTTPVPPGVQVVKLTSQWPAQATPLEASVKTDVSLEEKVMLVEILVPEEVCAEAVKLRVPPSAREVLLPGVRVTRPGKMGVPAFLLPPQPLKLHRGRIATATHKAFERNRPMHPSLLFLSLVPARRDNITQGESRMNWKTCSVEAGCGIGKRCAT